MMHKRMRLWLVLGGIFLALAPTSVPAAVKLPAIIGDNMVLQQGRPVPIWGWADKGEEVTVAVANQTAHNQGRRRRPLEGRARQTRNPASRWK